MMNQNVLYRKSNDSMDNRSADGSLSMTTNVYDDIKDFDLHSRCSYVFKKYGIFIVGSLVVLFFILVIAITILNLPENKLKSKNSKYEYRKSNLFPFYNQLIIIDSNEIKGFDLETKNLSTYKIVRNEIVAFEVGREAIYWTEKDSPKVRSLNSRGLKEVKHTKKLKPQAMAFDQVTGKFYITDESAETVSVIDKEGKYHGIVLSDIEKPHDLAIDVDEGVMFITQHLKSILRVNLDGSNGTRIIPNAKVTAISVDRGKKRILWVENSNDISCADYEGNNRKKLAESSASVKSLTLLGNQLFWLTSAYTNHNASLWSCKITADGVCEDYEVLPVPLRNPFSIKIYPGLDRAELEAGRNPCKVRNGNCSDFCLLVPGNKRSCGCRVGYQLNLDRQFCRHATELMIYVDNRYIRGAVLNPKNQEAFTDAILPTPVESAESLVDFEYDLINDNLYFTDGQAIYVTSIVTDSEQRSIVNVNSLHRIVDLSFDWLSNILYYSMDSVPGVENRIVAVTRDELRDSFRQVTVDVGNDSYECPHSMFVVADQGYLFFSRCEISYYENFHRLDMNGSSIKNLHQFGHKNELEIFALDRDEDRVYFFDATKRTVFRADFDFKSIQTVYNVSIENTTFISVYKEHIFLSNSAGVWRLDKRNASDCVRVLPKFEYNNSARRVLGIKVVSLVSHANDVENLCAANNGGCDQFCFSRPTKTCGCERDKLQGSGRCDVFYSR